MDKAPSADPFLIQKDWLEILQNLNETLRNKILELRERAIPNSSGRSLNNLQTSNSISEQDLNLTLIQSLKVAHQTMQRSISKKGFYASSNENLKKCIENYALELKSYINLYQVSPDSKEVLSEIIDHLKEMQQALYRQTLNSQDMGLTPLFQQYLASIVEYLHEIKKDYGSQARLLAYFNQL